MLPCTRYSPPITTLAEALRKDFLIGFPGLTKETLAKYPPQSIATIKGHVDQACTKQERIKPPIQEMAPNPSDPNEDIYSSFFPSSDQPNVHTHHCYAVLIEITGQVYGDQTCKLSIPSSWGNKYDFCLYDYNSNHIDAEPDKEQRSTINSRGI
jgi:hypothetical protein